MRVTPLGSLNPLQGVGSLPGLCLLLGQLSCFDPMAALAQDTPLGVHTPLHQDGFHSNGIWEGQWQDLLWSGVPCLFDPLKSICTCVVSPLP